MSAYERRVPKAIPRDSWHKEDRLYGKLLLAETLTSLTSFDKLPEIRPRRLGYIDAQVPGEAAVHLNQPCGLLLADQTTGKRLG